ncbi:peptidoglycan-binding domain-containing protein [Rhodospirillum centenum]|nr:peptidoglycan-binding domain-containing protein [Rhodospirillum centenum]
MTSVSGPSGPARPFRSPAWARRSRGPALGLLLALAALTAAPPAPRAEDAPNGATIQWAQQILDEKGFYQGRAHGRLDAATTAAVKAYQKSVGLKVTGTLDKATVDRLLADRSTAEKPTVGNLADPNSRARSSSPMVKERDVRPTAAPSAPGVSAVEGGETGSIIEPGAVSPVTPRGPAPSAATAPAVSRETAASPDYPTAPASAPRAGVETVGAEEGEGAGFDLRSVIDPGYISYGLMGLVGVIVAYLGFSWWSSGRTRAAARRRPPAGRAPVGGGPARREPTLGAPPRAPDGRREPRFDPPPRPPGAGGARGSTGLRSRMP